MDQLPGFFVVALKSGFGSIEHIWEFGSGDLRLRAAALRVKIASAVGAGDSFLAAMVWRLSSGSTLEEAFRYGVAAGTAALLTPGTELCREDDTARLYGQVSLARLEEPDP